MKFIVRIIGVVVLLLTCGASQGYRLQTGVPLGTQWSRPDRIPGYAADTRTPYLVADQNQTIHAFASVRTDPTEMVIVYSQWKNAIGWTSPIDILLDPMFDQAQIMGAFLDQSGMVNVIFIGGNDQNAAVFYSKAPLVQAGRAASWSRLNLIGEHASSPVFATLAGDGKGKLTVVYTGSRDGRGLYAVYSSDGGDTWTDPVVVYKVPDVFHFPANPSMILDHQGRLQLVWTSSNDHGIGDMVLYSRLDPDRKQWSDPTVIAQRKEGDYSADWGSITEFQNKLLVLFQNSTPATRWMRQSTDGGNTWSDPVLPFNYVGEYGHVAYVIDSGNYLHMLLGNRTPENPPTHGMWHSIWLGDHWSDPEPVVSGSPVTSGPMVERFDPTAPTAVVSQGNLLMAVWATDPNSGRNGIWYSYTSLNTPQLPSVPLITPTPRPTSTPIGSMLIAGTPAAEKTVLLATGQDSAPGAPIHNPTFFLSLSIIPAVLLILVVVIIHRLRIRSRRI